MVANFMFHNLLSRLSIFSVFFFFLHFFVVCLNLLFSSKQMEKKQCLLIPGLVLDPLKLFHLIFANEITSSGRW